MVTTDKAIELPLEWWRGARGEPRRIADERGTVDVPWWRHLKNFEKFHRDGDQEV